MKNKVSIILLILILVVVAVFTMSAAGVKIDYIENYGTNFRRNVKSIAGMFDINLPEPVENFLNQTPPPLSTEEKLALIEEMEKEEAEKNATPEPTKIPTSSDKTISAGSKVVSFRNAYAAAYEAYNSQLLCASDTRLVCYGQDGSEVWSSDIQLSSPVLKVSGEYIMAADRGATRVYLFHGDKKLWGIDVANTIISADVSSNGDVVIVNNKEHFKGGVTVVNKKGETVYSWSSGHHEVMDADISMETRTLAVALINTDSGADSQIQFFNIKEENSYKTVDITDTIVFDIEFCDEILNAAADNKLIGYKVSGDEDWTREFGGRILNRYNVEDSGYKLCVFDNSNMAEISVFTNRGSERSSFETQDFPDKIDICNGFILYNHERTLNLMSMSGKHPRIYNCTNDIYNLFILNSKCLAVVYNSSIEFINL